MTQNTRKPHLHLISIRLPEKPQHVLLMWKSGWTKQIQLWKKKQKKNELLGIGDRIRLSLVRKEPLTFASSWVPFQTSAKYSGVHLDETLSVNEQISSLCGSSNFHLRKIGSIRPYLSDASTAKLVLFLILSRLDYCNSTLSGLHSSSLNRLQKVQNNAARLVFRKRESDHVTHMLKQRHWLSIEACIRH